MKKLVLTLALSMAFPVMAQTAVSAPAAPTVPSTVTVSPNATAALNNASTNRVFIDQSGVNPDVNITQDGSGNRAGTVTNPVYLRGADQKVITIQEGNNNNISLEVVNSTSGTDVGATVTVQQTGNSNVLDASCGNGVASDGITNLSGCNAADLNWKFTGNSNSFQFRGTGDDLKSSFDVSGNGNSFLVDALGNKHTQTVMVVGDDNTFNLKQNSTGAAGSSILIDQTGTGASYTIQQSGNIDNVVNIKSVAAGGTFNILQKN